MKHHAVPFGGGVCSITCVVLKLDHPAESPGRFTEMQMARPQPQVLTQRVWSVTREFSLLTSSQVMLRLLAWEPPFENHCLDLYKGWGVGGKVQCQVLPKLLSVWGAVNY